MIEGPLTTMLPASFLQLHLDVEVMLDQAAARDLNGGDGGPTGHVAGSLTRRAD